MQKKAFRFFNLKFLFAKGKMTSPMGKFALGRPLFCAHQSAKNISSVLNLNFLPQGNGLLQQGNLIFSPKTMTCGLLPHRDSFSTRLPNN
jgi:hypothetical protein